MPNEKLKRRPTSYSAQGRRGWWRQPSSSPSSGAAQGAVRWITSLIDHHTVDKGVAALCKLVKLVKLCVSKGFLLS